MNVAFLSTIAILLALSSIVAIIHSMSYVEYTLMLDNNTLLLGNVNATGGGNPIAMTFDPNNNYLYVLAQGNIFVINPTNNTIIDKISVPNGSTSILYVPTNGYIYVATNGSGILVIDTSTKEVVGKIPIDGEIWQMIYVNGHIYASVYSSSEVIVIDPSNNTIVATIKVGLEPIGIAYDPKNSYIYVANYGSGTISIINTKNNSLVTSIAIGGYPWGIAYDPENGYLYVAEYNGKVVVVDPMSDKVVAIPIGNGIARCITYDPSNGLIYVTVDSYNAPNNVTIIDPSNDSIVGRIQVGYIPWGITYVPTNNNLYVANKGSGTLSIIVTQVTESTSSTPTTFVPTPTLSSVKQGIDVVIYIILAIVVVAIIMLLFSRRK